MRIIFIAGYGRSGSTLLESILNNAEDTISVGECYRFFNRYYEGTSLCGCSQNIRECLLWSRVHEELQQQIYNYNPGEIWQQITYLLKFKNFQNIKNLFEDKKYNTLKKTVRLFYSSIAKFSNKSIIIDSSKSTGWLRIIHEIGFESIQIIHLERDLLGVSDSWKKRKRLAEYPNSLEYMPIKPVKLVIKEWYKVRWGMKYFKKNNYLFVSYNSWMLNFEEVTNKILIFLNLELPKTVQFKNNHAIAGNPMRKGNKEIIKVHYVQNEPKNLNNIEKCSIYFASLLKKII